MAIGDVYRLRVVLRRSFVHPACINNFYFKAETITIFDTQEEDLVQAWQLSAETAYRNCFTNFIAITQYQVAKAPDFNTAFVLDLAGTPGNLTGDALPPRTSFVLSWRTAVLSKRGRGRVYLPPASEADNSSGAPTAGYRTTVSNFGDLLIGGIGDALTTAQYTLMMWSPADQVAREVTSHFSVGGWGSQRDRDGILSA